MSIVHTLTNLRNRVLDDLAVTYVVTKCFAYNILHIFNIVTARDSHRPGYRLTSGDRTFPAINIFWPANFLHVGFPRDKKRLF